MAILQLGDHQPRIPASAWVAESATLVGRVELGEHASVWYGAVLRADNDRITVGRGTNVQDNCVLHADAGVPLAIGDDVTIGHQSVLHGCTVGNGTLIGIRAVVLNGAVIGRHCLIGAGALVTEDKTFPDGSLIVGAPARVVRTLDAARIESLLRSARHYVELAQRHRSSGRHVER